MARPRPRSGAWIEMVAALKLVGVRKSFDGFLALDDADFEANTGEVHALLGENGAGKSSLMNVAAGLYTAGSRAALRRRRRGRALRPARCHGLPHRHGAPGIQAGEAVHRRRKRAARQLARAFRTGSSRNRATDRRPKPPSSALRSIPAAASTNCRSRSGSGSRSSRCCWPAPASSSSTSRRRFSPTRRLCAFSRRCGARRPWRRRRAGDPQAWRGDRVHRPGHGDAQRASRRGARFALDHGQRTDPACGRHHRRSAAPRLVAARRAA